MPAWFPKQNHNGFLLSKTVEAANQIPPINNPTIVKTIANFNEGETILGAGFHTLLRNHNNIIKYLLISNNSLFFFDTS